MKLLKFLLLLIASTNVNAYTLSPSSSAKWGSPTLGTGATISYSYMLGGEACDTGSCSSLDSFMPTDYKTEIGKAFDAWSSVTNLNFFEVTDDGADAGSITSSGDIRIGGENMDGQHGVLAHAYYPHTSSWGGDLHFDLNETWSIDGFAGTISIFWVALHEIGHSLGLGHSDDSNSIMGPYYNPHLTTLGADDIAGIQHLYGTPVLSAVPIPAALWLLAPALIGLFGFRKTNLNSI